MGLCLHSQDSAQIWSFCGWVGLVKDSFPHSHLLIVVQIKQLLGQPINESEQLSIEKTLLEKHSAVPVFIPDHLADLYYDKFSNSYSISCIYA